MQFRQYTLYAKLLNNKSKKRIKDCTNRLAMLHNFHLTLILISAAPAARPATAGVPAGTAAPTVGRGTATAAPAASASPAASGTAGAASAAPTAPALLGLHGYSHEPPRGRYLPPGLRGGANDGRCYAVEPLAFGRQSTGLLRCRRAN